MPAFKNLLISLKEKTFITQFLLHIFLEEMKAYIQAKDLYTNIIASLFLKDKSRNSSIVQQQMNG